MSGPEITTCRDCGGDVFWAETRACKKMQMDAEENDSGEYTVDFAGTMPSVRKASDAEREDTGREVYTCHFDTCESGGDRSKQRESASSPVVQCPKCAHRFVGRSKQ